MKVGWYVLWVVVCEYVWEDEYLVCWDEVGVLFDDFLEEVFGFFVFFGFWMYGVWFDG